MKTKVLVLLTLFFVISPSTQAADFACGCDRVPRTGAKLVITNLQTGQRRELGTFSGGGVLATTAEGQGVQECNRTLATMSVCTRPPRNLDDFVCSCDMVPRTGAELKITNLTTGLTFPLGLYVGTSGWATKTERQGTHECMKALAAQSACTGSAAAIDAGQLNLHVNARAGRNSASIAVRVSKALEPAAEGEAAQEYDARAHQAR